MKNRCIQIIKKKILAYFQTKICMHVQLRKIKELFNKTVLVLRMRSAFLDQPWKKKMDSWIRLFMFMLAFASTILNSSLQ